MIAEVGAYVAGVLVLLGAIFSLLAVVGLLRLPDLYTRMHAASKAGTVGSGLCLVAIAVASLDVSVALRALVGLAFLVLTAPIAAHLLARAAYMSGLKPSDTSVINDVVPTEVENLNLPPH